MLNSICGYAHMLLKLSYITFCVHSLATYTLMIPFQLMEISKNLVLVESGRILDSTTRFYDAILPQRFRSESESQF
jgi:hypothetical protein